MRRRRLLLAPVATPRGSHLACARGWRAETVHPFPVCTSGALRRSDGVPGAALVHTRYVGLALTVALCAVAPAALIAQRPPAPSAATTSYHALLARLRARDTTIDFTALRLAYAASDDYTPYGSAADDYRDSLNAALERNDYARAVSVADSALNTDYLDVRTHVMKAYAAEQLGDSAAALWDRIVAGRLVASIMRSGAGTVDSPYVVISVAEEYAVLGMNGYVRGSQGLGTCGPRPCDVLQVTVRRSGAHRTIYFDISLPSEHLHRVLQGKP